MRVKRILDWGASSSVALIPTVMSGISLGWSTECAWSYLYWLRGRAGFSVSWERRKPAVSSIPVQQQEGV